MRTPNAVMTFTGATTGDMAGSLTSDPFRLEHLDMAAIQAVFSGAPVGSLKLQASNDLGVDVGTGMAGIAASLTNWTDVSGSTQAISAAGDHMWNLTAPAFKWVRVVYTRTSGTGTLSLRANGKGTS